LDKISYANPAKAKLKFIGCILAGFHIVQTSLIQEFEPLSPKLNLNTFLGPLITIGTENSVSMSFSNVLLKLFKLFGLIASLIPLTSFEPLWKLNCKPFVFRNFSGASNSSLLNVPTFQNIGACRFPFSDWRFG
jgi:hypothetical protein